ncbi:hypothetical protein ROA7450_01361 [Roseovarius albus]|uniref:Thioesterase superfamily protein n=1 Tax=Roseovarius albus TaxID=1247867 RepID=A0A1X6YTE4_9RHOB|nr:acyl-CoA thioesterase [Roseovarius albus]SLN30955.1 hypothetical protein ROA7450_01361 [Roseovarius albus]
MYPFLRMIIQLITIRNLPRIGVTETHVSRHMCMPWDLDIWLELNNGRTLTIFDLGRIPLAVRVGLTTLLKEHRWGLTVAGSSVRYRRRIRMFEVVEMKSRGVCWDDKFFYLEQSMWKKNGECANHAMYRTAITDKNGIVPPIKVMEALGAANINPEMPAWFAAWIAAEDQRPWPPMQD